MDVEEYRKHGKELIDYIADYLENIRERRVLPDVKPGYIRSLIPSEAPVEPESWEALMVDMENVIMPGITHWQSPHMHAYFPALNSYPSMLGEMLANAINCIGFTWASSPACTELEIVVTDWLGKMIGLPGNFLHSESEGIGGGVLQTTASESTLISILAARTEALKKYKEFNDDDLEDAVINGKLVGYCSDQAHSSIEKGSLISLVKMRYLESDECFSLRGARLTQAIEEDKKQGLIPFYVCATLGTTGACAFDNLQELGPICRENSLWLHVDAAYAGTAFICPEFRHWLDGVEYIDSLTMNCSKWMMVHFDCTAMWVRNSRSLHRTFNVDPLYLQHENSGSAIDFMHWQIPLSRRFRALKLWFVIRKYGITGLQKHVREGVRLAKKFESFIAADNRFEVPAKRELGLVVFRLCGDNLLTEKLLKLLNSRGNLHCVPASLKGKYVIRYVITSTRTTLDDVLKDWLEIKCTADMILSEEEKIKPREKVPLAEVKERSELFGSSLLLANSPMSPKIVNGSFAAIFYPFNEIDDDWTKGWLFLTNIHKGSPARKKKLTKKQFSLDSRLDLVEYCIGIKSATALPPCSEFAPCLEVSPTEKDELESENKMATLEVEGQLRQNRSKSLGESLDEVEDGTADGNKKGFTQKVCLQCGHLESTNN